jgi:peptidase E
MSKEIEEVKETQKEKYLRNMKRAGVVIGLIAGSVIASLR